MSFVDLATLAVHTRHELKDRIKIFLNKCDVSIKNMEKLKSQVCGFVDFLNCEPSELKERFLTCTRHLDEYTYLLTDFNLALNKLDFPNETDLRPVHDTSTTPLPFVPPVANYNLFDKLIESAPSTSAACPNMCAPEKPIYHKQPRGEQLLIQFSSTSCSSESVPLVLHEKQVQCQIDKDLQKLCLDDSARPDDCNLPSQTILEVDQTYEACIMHVDGTTLWVNTESVDDIYDFFTYMTDHYKSNKVDLKLEDLMSLTYCAHYDEESDCYYRGLYMKLTEDDMSVAEIFLVDTGELRRAPVSTLQPLHGDLLRTPPFARCCHLAGIDLSAQSKEAVEQQETFLKDFLGKECYVKIDDNSSESLGVYITMITGESLNDLMVQKGIAHAIDRCDASATISCDARQRADTSSELAEATLDIGDCPEYEDPVEAVTGYRNRDEMDICKNYKGGPEKKCFKGDRCNKRHVLMHPDGWTLDRVAVPTRVPSPPLPAPGVWLRVYVTHVAYYDKLFVQLVDDNKKDVSPPIFGVVRPPTTLDSLIQDMNSPASRSAYKPLKLIPAPGELVAALYPSDDQWYRAQVLTTTRADQSVEVFYIDYGNIVWVKEDAVRALEPRWCSLEAQAIRCSLAGVLVEAAEPRTLGAARRALQDLVNDRRLDAYVICRDYNEITVELYDERGCSIAEELAATSQVKLTPYRQVDDKRAGERIVVP